jgi:hypothetical protein
MNNKNEVFEGDLIAKAGEVYQYAKVNGYILVPAGVTAEFTKLTSVGTYIYLRENAKGSFPVLTSVGNSIDLGENAKGSFPVLTSVGNFIDLGENAKGSFPVDVKKNDPTAAVRCRSLLLSSFAAAGFSFADGVLARTVSTRGPVSRVIICGKTEVSYLVTDGEAFSHGKTLTEARDGLLFKIGKRDPSEFKGWKLSQTVTKRDAIRAYRVITGACEGGVRSWLEQRTAPEKITVEEIITLTKGAYGAEEFKNFFLVNLAPSDGGDIKLQMGA